jgi:hypothetical protein
VNRTLWKGEIYIESVSYAIMKLTQKPSMEAFNTYEKKKYRNTYELRNKPGWIAEMPHIHLTMTYCPRNGKWTLGTMQNEYWILFTFPATGEKITINSKSEVVVTDVTYDPEKLAGFRGVEKKGNLQRWDQVIGDSDESFWATFNYLPVEMKLKESLEYLGRQ